MTNFKDSKVIKEHKKICSKISKSRTKGTTCLTLEQLKKIAGVNRGTKADIISFLENLFNIPFKEIEKNLYLYVKDISLAREIKYMTFKTGVNNPEQSLKTSEIDSIMFQALSYPEFKNYKYLGCHPADYRGKVLKSKNCGIILNTDPSNRSGKHWVAISIKKGGKHAEYFDPLGGLPNKYISTFLSQFETVNKNTREYQKIFGLCGLYCINFLLCQAGTKKGWCVENEDKEIKKIFKHLIK